MEKFCGYDVFDKLGEGAYGAVYRITDRYGNSFALKNPLFGEYGIDCLEYDLLRKVKSPYILNAMDYLTPFNCGDTTTASIVMPLAKYTGKDIMRYADNLLARINIMRRLILGLKCMNSLGYIHCDIKPANIVFYDVDHPALSDFGSTVYVGEPNKVIRIPSATITPAYAAPESMFPVGGLYTLSNKSDVWSLGATFYEWLLGYPLVSRNNNKMDNNTYKTIANEVTYDNLYRALQNNYDQLEHKWLDRLATMLNRMLQHDYHQRISIGEALQYVMIVDVPDQLTCESNYLMPIPTAREDFHDFPLARQHLMAFIYRLTIHDNRNLTYRLAYVICDAFWKCYIMTPPDFDLWSALVLGVYCYILNCLEYQTGLTTTPTRLIYDQATINMCQYLAITYNYTGLLDFSYVDQLSEPQEPQGSQLQHIMKNVMLGNDPYKILNWYNLPTSRERGAGQRAGVVSNFSSFFKDNLISERIANSLRQFDLFDKMFSAKTDGIHKYNKELREYQTITFVDPFTDSQFILDHGIKIPIVKELQLDNTDDDGL